MALFKKIKSPPNEELLYIILSGDVGGGILQPKTEWHKGRNAVNCML